jgi:hypothetical protein
MLVSGTHLESASAIDALIEIFHYTASELPTIPLPDARYHPEVREGSAEQSVALRIVDLLMDF